MDSRKKTRIDRESLLLADYVAVIIDYKPSKYLTYLLPRQYKAFFQFRDPTTEGYWSVELLIEIDDHRAKLLEVTPRGITYKRGLDIEIKDYSFQYPTEEIKRWQIALVQNNLVKLIAHSLALGVASFDFRTGKSWTLKGRDLSESEFQRIRTEVANKKRERFTPEKAKEVRKILDRERKKARESGTKYRGNEVLAEEYGISIKTAEKWAERVSTPSSGKKTTNKKGKK